MTTSQTWPAVLSALLDRRDLPAEATAWAMAEIMSGSATPAQIAGFVVALRAKGETVDEVEGLVQAMYDHATPISIPGPAVDVVGTGGDRAHTVNISTMAALVAAGAGVRVVKHGNRAASSACGAADLLEELGIRLDLPAARVAEIAVEVGITFCFAPVFHPALRHAAVPRRELGIPTTFNFLGPLANPAKPTAQAVGVADGRMAGIVAGVLAGRGVSALVFRGDDGLDELTTTTTSRVWMVRDGAGARGAARPVGPRHPRCAAGRAARRRRDAQRRGRRGGSWRGRRAPCATRCCSTRRLRWWPTTASDGALVDQLRPALDRAADAVDTGAAADVLERWVAACSG